MSFSYNGYALADIEITGTFGRIGVGVSLLCASIVLRIPETAFAGVKLRDVQLRVFADTGTISGPAFIGFAQPEVPLELSTKSGQDIKRLIFELPLSEGQLFALEKLRNGNDLTLRFRFTALADGPTGIWHQQSEITHKISLSDWSKVLVELHGPEYMVIGIAIPQCQAGQNFVEAVGRIKRAHMHLVDGRFDAVVSECRLAIESVSLASGEKAAIAAASDKLRSAKRDMTKLERELALMESVRHYTQLAHHVDESGAAEYYSRDDANMLLTAAAALVSSTIARH